MHSIDIIEKSFRKCIKKLSHLNSENFLNVDLKLLHDLDLLQFQKNISQDFGLTRYFQVIETPDKITMLNEEFVVWIVPEIIDNKNVTYVMIALNGKKEPVLEFVILLSGVYNTSHLILSVLGKFLFEIQENEEFLSKLQV